MTRARMQVGSWLACLGLLTWCGLVRAQTAPVDRGADSVVLAVTTGVVHVRPSPWEPFEVGDLVEIVGAPRVVGQVLVVGRRGLVVRVARRARVVVGAPVRRIEGLDAEARERLRPGSIAAPSAPPDGLRLRFLAGPTVADPGAVGELELVVRRASLELFAALFPSIVLARHEVDRGGRIGPSQYVDTAVGAAFASRFVGLGAGIGLHVGSDSTGIVPTIRRFAAGSIVVRGRAGALDGFHVETDVSVGLEPHTYARVHHWTLGLFFPATHRTMLVFRLAGYGSPWWLNEVDVRLRQEVGRRRGRPRVYLWSSIVGIFTEGEAVQPPMVYARSFADRNVGLRLGVEIRTRRPEPAPH